MKIVSWNINSLRLRIGLLKKFIDLANPDIICLQETKVEDQLFPAFELISYGYNFIEFCGEKSYNGVAILSKFSLKNTSKIDILDYGHKRHISSQIQSPIGDVTIHNFYVPAGGDIADPIINDKFAHKIKFVDWMGDFFGSQNSSQSKVVIVGDFNIAPLEHDVWSHKQMQNVVSHTAIEIEKLTRLQNSLGFIDSHRHFIDPQEKLYSWWSYRALEPLKSNRGRRLDHIWVSPDLKNHLSNCQVYRDFRLENQPSDHVPIETTFQF